MFGSFSSVDIAARPREWNVASRNAAALVDPPRHVKREICPLTPEQARALLQATGNHRLGALLSVAVALGLRLGEALGLRWSDVDFKAGTLSVRQAIERSSGDPIARQVLTKARRVLRPQIAAIPKRNPARRPLLAELQKLRKQWREVRTTLRTTEPKSTRSRRTLRMPTVVVTALKAHVNLRRG